MAHHHHVCPYWVGFWLLNPLRRFRQNPNKILSPHIRPGMTVLEVGPGMGYFTLTMAKLAGPQGKVVAVDAQEKMIHKLQKRAAKAGLTHRIDARVCPPNTLAIEDLRGKVDFALVFAVVHEVPDIGLFFRELRQSLKPGATVLVAEPSVRVPKAEFEETLRLAKESGFTVRPAAPISGEHTALLLNLDQ